MLTITCLNLKAPTHAKTPILKLDTLIAGREWRFHSYELEGWERCIE